MDFALTANQESIRDAVGKICSRSDDAYWLKKDKEGGYPADFHRALADAGWLGICIPEEYGGAGPRLPHPPALMRPNSEIGGGLARGPPAPLNLVGVHPRVLFRPHAQVPRHP